MAYQPVELVTALPLYPARRQPTRPGADASQRPHHDAAGWTLARRGVDLRVVGRLSRDADRGVSAAPHDRSPRVAIPLRGLAGGAGWLFCVVVFFHLVCLDWLLFRAQSLEQVALMGQAMFGNLHLADAIALQPLWWQFLSTVSLLTVIHVLQCARKNLLVVFEWPFLLRW